MGGKSAEAERAGHALGGGQPSASRLSAAKSLPASTYLAFGVLDSVTSGRGERSEPRIYPHGEAGAEGRASPQGAGHRGEAGGATVSVRREVSGESRDRRERLPPDTEQGRKVKPRAPRRLPPLSGERARWRQPIENEAGERSAPPPLEAERGLPRKRDLCERLSGQAARSGLFDCAGVNEPRYLLRPSCRSRASRARSWRWTTERSEVVCRQDHACETLPGIWSA